MALPEVGEWIGVCYHIIDEGAASEGFTPLSPTPATIWDGFGNGHSATQALVCKACGSPGYKEVKLYAAKWNGDGTLDMPIKRTADIDAGNSQPKTES